MHRRHVSYDCDGVRCAGTLDDAAGTSGLLIVTGGNETRAGAFSGQAMLAADVAAAGFPVFRYDRRGVGDSEGTNSGFRHEDADMAAAVAAFRNEAPQVTRITGFGNCDAASALMLSSGAGLGALVLSNPWTIENDAQGPSPGAVRARYWEKLKSPKELLRLLAGNVSFRKLAQGLAAAARPGAAHNSLKDAMAAGLEAFDGEIVFLLAGRDRTAKAFQAVWPSNDARIRVCEGASHAYAEQHARQWLHEQIISVLRS
ncbi:hydrolase 1, exosortase A system-associated [Altererythrobacter aquiaggeris]|uniref:hydrolase 1, exosortase A system-associated n=1 Tax=Aestuarierythrobacter aquiaggeris TaxID=1898396 RepID=UPI00301782B3